jgi:hypothetical protein
LSYDTGVMRRPQILLIAMFVTAAAFRFAIVHQYSSSSPDGDQYYRLSRELIRAGRYALGPQPKPLTYSRLPGFPLFAAAFSVRSTLTPQATVRRQAFVNVALDLATALLLVLMLRDVGARPRSGPVAVAMVAICPLMFLFAVYFLTESLATFLGTVSFWLAFTRPRDGSKALAVGSGAAVGAAMLVRADMVTLVPAVVCLLWTRAPAIRDRATTIGLALAAAALVLLPWAIRNTIQFGAPHVTAAEWPTQDGEPLPTGPMTWMRTWAAGRPGDGDLSGNFVFRAATGANDIRPIMYDTSQERGELASILEQYRREGLSPNVDARFVHLARQRIKQHPFRVFVVLPVMRAVRLFAAPPRGDYPIRVSFLGLPNHWHEVFDTANWAIYALAIGGLVILWRRPRRDLAVAIVVAVGARTMLHMWAVPTFVCQRYLIEVMPLLLLLATLSVEWILDRLMSRVQSLDAGRVIK